MNGRDPAETRVLIIAASPADATLTCSLLLEARMASHACPSLEDLCDELTRGAGVALLTEEVLSDPGTTRLVETLRSQPVWSDVPVLLLAHRGADSPIALQALEALPNVTVLERPVRIVTLISSLRTSLRARERQYVLRDQVEALAENDRRKDEFLATLAHELRNPLAPIRNAVEILRMKGSAGPELVWGRDVIDRQAAQMSRLLDDLLDVSRITRGKLELRRSRVTLGSVIERAIETSRPLIEGRRHELAISVPESLVLLDVDPVRVAQALSNLLNNAAKYTPEGGRIQLTAATGDGEVRLAVRDNGIGIEAALLPRVFEMFTQADGVHGQSQGGLGIGLSLARRLIEMHGGRVTAHSGGPGQGTTFTVCLPIGSSSLAGGDGPTDAGTPNGRRAPLAHRRVLVVDDLRESADSLTMLLRIAGHEVATAYDGAEAVAAAGAHHPDAILLDIGMPGLNGYDACRRIREQPWGRDVTLIALTGWGQEDDRRRSAEAGFDGHLVKPVDPEVLLEIIATLPRRPSRPLSAR